jgi:energy-coupling factor transport system ATP-binding protein
MTTVDFERVSFIYPDSDAPVLDDVTLNIPESTFALVTGHTGAGKSTFIRAINGLVPHFTGGEYSGSVTLRGETTRNTLDSAPRELADLVAFVPQDPSAAFVVDRVEDEIAYSLENLGVDRTVMRRRVEETLDALNIEGLRDRSVRTLSGGERQRVAIAAALAPGPRVLLLDEPTSQLDPQGAEDVLAALQRLVHDLGITVVLAEHRLERVAGFVDLAVGMRRGGPVTVGDPARVLELMKSGPPVARLGRLVGWSPPPLTVRDARRMAPTLTLGARPNDERAAGNSLLEGSGLRAGYGRRVVLNDIDVSLDEGEIVALMGRNGAGKTTLLRCLCGLHRPESGMVEVRGTAPVAGRDVALCPQRPESLLFAETVAGEVEATLKPAGSAASIETSLRALGIAELRDRHPRDLSAGQRLLVAIAAIVATHAPVLLLDEPTRGLDHESKTRLVGFLRSWAGRGRAVMLATHDVELAAEVATRVVMLAAGEVIADGKPGDVLGDSPVFAPQMGRAFGPGWLTPEQVVAAALSHGRPDERAGHSA